jgi:hypothetical protein
LGYASITTTLKIYSHVIPSMQKDAVEKIPKKRRMAQNQKSPG